SVEERVKHPEFYIFNVRLVEVNFCPDRIRNPAPVFFDFVQWEFSCPVESVVVVVGPALLWIIRQVKDFFRKRYLLHSLLRKDFIEIYKAYIMVQLVFFRDIVRQISSAVTQKLIVNSIPCELGAPEPFAQFIASRICCRLAVIHPVGTL